MARGLLALHGIDPIGATDLQWVGAMIRASEVDDLGFIRRTLELTAKESQKPKAARGGGFRRYGRRR